MTTSKKDQFEPGQLHAVPLFTSDIESNVRFLKRDLLIEGNKFCFIRIISNQGGSGLLIEVFDFVGGLDASVERIESAPRLFNPVAVSSLPITKHRWPLVGRTANYDRERHSSYSTIELVFSPSLQPQLWRGGAKYPIERRDIARYEPWIVWRANHLEKRIIEALAKSTVSENPVL